MVRNEFYLIRNEFYLVKERIILGEGIISTSYFIVYMFIFPFLFSIQENQDSELEIPFHRFAVQDSADGYSSKLAVNVRGSKDAFKDINLSG